MDWQADYLKLMAELQQIPIPPEQQQQVIEHLNVARQFAQQLFQMSDTVD